MKPLPETAEDRSVKPAGVVQGERSSGGMAQGSGKDDDVALAMGFARKAGVTVHLRGTDLHPVVELKDKRTRRVVGGIELKRRIARLKEKEDG